VDSDPDAPLVERCRSGDRAALAELMARYQRPIYNAAFWIVRRPEDANDVAQTVFLKVAERLGGYDGDRRFFSWIYRIAVNEALDVLRRNGHEQALDEDVEFADDRPEPGAVLAAAEAGTQVRAALLQLTVAQRTVIVLRHFSELSYREIADVLDVDEKTVKSRLFEARTRLRELLRPEDLAST
jgi:RNA polymerase sigma-70 factor (ECF subfamily)